MKHIFESDIVLFEKEREKITKFFDGLEHKIAKKADDAIGEMLDEFFTDTNVYIYFDGDELFVGVRNGDNGDYEISTSFNEAIEFLLEADIDDISADDCEKIAQIFQTTAAQFLEKAVKIKQASD